jgi:hypothetical protein
MTLIGLVLACGFVVVSYYKSPLSSAPYNGCSDCGNYLGHFWEPEFTLFLAAIGYTVWLLGVGAAISGRAGLYGARRLLRKRAAAS